MPRIWVGQLLRIAAHMGETGLLPHIVSLLQDDRFGFIARDGIAPVVVGETGGQLFKEDKVWQEAFVKYMIDRGIGLFYFALLVASTKADTRGLLKLDKMTPDDEVLNLLSGFPSTDIGRIKSLITPKPPSVPPSPPLQPPSPPPLWPPPSTPPPSPPFPPPKVPPKVPPIQPYLAPLSLPSPPLLSLSPPESPRASPEADAVYISVTLTVGSMLGGGFLLVAMCLISRRIAGCCSRRELTTLPQNYGNQGTPSRKQKRPKDRLKCHKYSACDNVEATEEGKRDVPRLKFHKYSACDHVEATEDGQCDVPRLKFHKHSACDLVEATEEGQRDVM